MNNQLNDHQLKLVWVCDRKSRSGGPFLSSDWKYAKAQLKLLFLDYRKIISRFFFPLIFDISLYRFFIYFPYSVYHTELEC